MQQFTTLSTVFTKFMTKIIKPLIISYCKNIPFSKFDSTVLAFRKISSGHALSRKVTHLSPSPKTSTMSTEGHPIIPGAILSEM